MGGFFVLSDVTMDNSRGKFMPPCCFHQVEVHHFNRPKISNNSLIRDQKSYKHIANGYKTLVHTFKREAVQFFVAKNLAVYYYHWKPFLRFKREVQSANVTARPWSRDILRFAVSREKPDAKGL